MKSEIKTEKYDLHIKYTGHYEEASAWISYDDKSIYIDLKFLKSEIKRFRKETGYRYSFSQAIANAISHEEIHRCIRQIEGKVASNLFDNYVRKKLNKKQVRELIADGMW